VQQQRIVAREVAPVVGQQADAIAGDLGIGGVGVDHVDPAAGKRLVGKAVIEPGRGELRQAVGFGQPGPAVLAGDELLRQPQSQVRMSGEIGDGIQAQARRQFLAHAERIGVVEPKGNRDCQSDGRKRAVQFGESRIAFELQDLAGDGAAVFGIDVDGARAQRGVENAGIAQARLMFRWATPDGGLNQQRAEYVGLREALGTDLQDVGRRRRRRMNKQRGEQRGEQPALSAEHPHRCHYGSCHHQ